MAMARGVRQRNPDGQAGRSNLSGLKVMAAAKKPLPSWQDRPVRHEASARLPAAARHGGLFLWTGTPTADQEADPGQPHAVADQPFDDAHGYISRKRHVPDA